MGALTLGQDCVNSVTTQIRTSLERVAEGGTELVSTVKAYDWQPLCQSIHMLSGSSICILNCCDVWCVVRCTSYRTSRQTHDISYLTYVRSYDKVARSTIEAIKINSDLLIELWVDANRIQLKLRSEQLTWSSSQESQLFKTVPNAIWGTISREILHSLRS